jgi:cobalt-zinc-cadmium efflux system outer membrane protein
MFMMKLNIAALLAGLLIIMPAHAQNKKEGSVLDLDDAVSMAMENNPAYMTLQRMQDEIKHSWKSESGIVQPELTYTREGLGDTDQFFEQRLSVSQSLEQPFSVIQKSKAADWRLKALNKRIEAYKRQLQEDVKTQYIELLYALHMDSLRAERIRTAENLKEAVEFKYEQGSADKLDVLNARVRLDKAKNEKNNSVARLHRERYRLFELIGLDPEDQKYEIRFADSLQTYEPPIPQDSVLAALENYPAYEQYRMNMIAAEHSLKAAKAGWFPSLSLSYYQQDFSNGFNYQGFEVGIGIPLWGAHSIRGDVKTRQALLDQAGWQAEGKMLEMKRQVEHAWHAYEEARAVIQRYQSGQKAENADLLELTEEAYRLGEIDLIRLIDAQQLYLDNQALYLKSLRDYYIYLSQLEKFMNKELVY